MSVSSGTSFRRDPHQSPRPGPLPSSLSMSSSSSAVARMSRSEMLMTHLPGPSPPTNNNNNNNGNNECISEAHQRRHAALDHRLSRLESQMEQVQRTLDSILQVMQRPGTGFGLILQDAPQSRADSRGALVTSLSGTAMAGGPGGGSTSPGNSAGRSVSLSPDVTVYTYNNDGGDSVRSPSVSNAVPNNRQSALSSVTSPRGMFMSPMATASSAVMPVQSPGMVHPATGTVINVVEEQHRFMNSYAFELERRHNELQSNIRALEQSAQRSRDQEESLMKRVRELELMREQELTGVVDRVDERFAQVERTLKVQTLAISRLEESLVGWGAKQQEFEVHVQDALQYLQQQISPRGMAPSSSQ